MIKGKEIPDVILIWNNILYCNLEDEDGLKDQLSRISKSKFKYRNKTSSSIQIQTLVCLSAEAIIYINDHDVEYKMQRGSSMLFYSDLNFTIKHGDCFSYKATVEANKPFGSGSKEYEVTSIVSDEYKIKVLADSEEEALRVADSIDIYEWDHLDINKHLPTKNILRFSRWGNFKVNKTS
jgi:hypothetical protein